MGRGEIFQPPSFPLVFPPAPELFQALPFVKGASISCEREKKANHCFNLAEREGTGHLYSRIESRGYVNFDSIRPRNKDWGNRYIFGLVKCFTSFSRFIGKNRRFNSVGALYVI